MIYRSRSFVGRSSDVPGIKKLKKFMGAEYAPFF